MNIYIVTREGVYRHEILGVYDSVDVADARAQEVAKAEEDFYHEIMVSSAKINDPMEDSERLFAYRNTAARGSGGGSEIERS